jgi:hypothetical protein
MTPRKRHPPCVVCGKRVVRRRKEAPSRWLERLTCCPACTSVARGRSWRNRTSWPKPASDKPPRVRGPRKRSPKPVVPERRVAFDRFPEPEGMRPAWTAAVGESLPPVSWERAGCPTRPPELATAIGVHPDLATALAGALTDSWVPFSKGSGYAMHTERT